MYGSGGQVNHGNGRSFDERDDMPLEALIKNGKPADMDWFYLENRVR